MFQAAVVVSLIISISNFLANTQLPVFVLLFGGSQFSTNHTHQCVKACNCSDNVTSPYIAPGPSKIVELVPLSVLQKNVQLDSHDGLKYLDHVSLSRFYQCHSSTKMSLSDAKWCSGRTFRNKGSPIVALVSFHGSGNTWLRYLLEQATGYYTGSIYCDSALKAVFPGESVASGNVVAVKTHHSDSRDLPKDIQLATGQEKYHKAVVLVRNPFDALISEANRRWNSKQSRNAHIGLANEASFISKWTSTDDTLT